MTLAASDGGGVTLFCDLGEVAVELLTLAGSGAGRLAVSMAVLAAVEGPGDDPVAFHVAGRRGTARWSDRGGPRELWFDVLDPGPDPPDRPTRWASVPADFCAALHEAGRTAARTPGRYALHRIQLRGKTGEVVATDAQHALVQTGFRFPFSTDVLVPAVPVFGAAGLWANAVRVGRAGDRLVVSAGGLIVWLRVDPAGKFPDVAGAIPRGPQPTIVALAAADAAAVHAALPTLPGSAEQPAVTLDAAPTGVVVRARPTDGGEVVEVRLPHSTPTGPSVRIALDRRHLARALALGLTTVRLAGPDRPVVFADANRTYLAVARDPAEAVGPTGGRRDSRCPPPEESPMRPGQPDHPTNNGRPRPIPDNGLDPLAEAEALRALLADAAARSTRLVAALKGRRKEQKALTQVYSSLRALNLGPEGGR